MLFISTSIDQNKAVIVTRRYRISRSLER